jgi:hypothetical protein
MAKIGKFKKLTNLIGIVRQSVEDFVNHNSELLRSKVKGDKGDKGDRGERGYTGQRGLKGEKGSKGDKGYTGLRGDIGPMGQSITQVKFLESNDPLNRQGIAGCTDVYQVLAGSDARNIIGYIKIRNGSDTLINPENNLLEIQNNVEILGNIYQRAKFAWFQVEEFAISAEFLKINYPSLTNSYPDEGAGIKLWDPTLNIFYTLKYDKTSQNWTISIGDNEKVLISADENHPTIITKMFPQRYTTQGGALATIYFEEFNALSNTYEEKWIVFSTTQDANAKLTNPHLHMDLLKIDGTTLVGADLDLNPLLNCYVNKKGDEVINGRKNFPTVLPTADTSTAVTDTNNIGNGTPLIPVKPAELVTKKYTDDNDIDIGFNPDGTSRTKYTPSETTHTLEIVRKDGQKITFTLPVAKKDTPNKTSGFMTPIQVEELDNLYANSGVFMTEAVFENNGTTGVLTLKKSYKNSYNGTTSSVVVNVPVADANKHGIITKTTFSALNAPYASDVEFSTDATTKEVKAKITKKNLITGIDSEATVVVPAIATALKGAAGGVAELDTDKIVPRTQLPLPRIFYVEITSAITQIVLTNYIPGYVPQKGDIIAIQNNHTAAVALASPHLKVGTTTYVLRNNNANYATATLPIGQSALISFTGTTFNTTHFWDWSDSDNTDDTRIGANSLIAGVAVTKYKLVMMGLDSKLYPLCVGDTTAATKTTSTQIFSMAGIPYFVENSGTIAANAKFGAALKRDKYYSNANVAYAFNGFASTDFNKRLYLVGTIEGGGFKLDQTSVTSWYTTAEPATEDGRVYLPIGYIGDTATILLLQYSGQWMEFKNSRFQPWTDPDLNSDVSYSKEYSIMGNEVSLNINVPMVEIVDIPFKSDGFETSLLIGYPRIPYNTKFMNFVINTKNAAPIVKVRNPIDNSILDIPIVYIHKELRGSDAPFFYPLSLSDVPLQNGLTTDEVAAIMKPGFYGVYWSYTGNMRNHGFIKIKEPTQKQLDQARVDSLGIPLEFEVIQGLVTPEFSIDFNITDNSMLFNSVWDMLNRMNIHIAEVIPLGLGGKRATILRVNIDEYRAFKLNRFYRSVWVSGENIPLDFGGFALDLRRTTPVLKFAIMNKRSTGSIIASLMIRMNGDLITTGTALNTSIDAGASYLYPYEFNMGSPYATLGLVLVEILIGVYHSSEPDFDNSSRRSACYKVTGYIEASSSVSFEYGRIS